MEVGVKGREKKSLVVDNLENEFRRARVVILTDYRGLVTKDVTGLRRKLGDSGAKYKVVKNTMAVLALKRLGREEMAGMFTGPVAVAIGYEDEIKPAKVMFDYIKGNNINLTVKGGILGERAISADEVTALAKLPPREVLVAQAVSGLKRPVYNLVAVLSSPLQRLTWVLQSITKQMQGG